MVIEVFIVLMSVCVAATFINGIEDHNKRNKMSFRETLDLTGLPIVTFRQGENKFNFLLDTGASKSVINANSLPLINHAVLEGTGNTYGIDGNKIEVTYANITIGYKDDSYTHVYQVLDIQAALDNLKADHDVNNIVGLIGSDFMAKYGYVLDFTEYVAYKK